jgi:hypothetical protein
VYELHCDITNMVGTFFRGSMFQTVSLPKEKRVLPQVSLAYNCDLSLFRQQPSMYQRSPIIRLFPP